MANVKFPSAKSPHRGFAGELRGWLNRVASYVDRSPDGAAMVGEHLDALAKQMNIPLTGNTVEPK